MSEQTIYHLFKLASGLYQGSGTSYFWDDPENPSSDPYRVDIYSTLVPPLTPGDPMTAQSQVFTPGDIVQGPSGENVYEGSWAWAEQP